MDSSAHSADAFFNLIKKEKRRRKKQTGKKKKVSFNVEIDEVYKGCMVKMGSKMKLNNKKKKKKKKMTTRTTILEFNPDYAPMSITVPGFRGRKYENLKAWDEGESEEIPWWEMPDLDEEDEITGLIKKVTNAGDFDKKHFQKKEIYEAYSQATDDVAIDTETIDLAANRVEGILYKFALKLKSKIESKVKEEEEEPKKKRQSMYMSTYNWSNKDLWDSATDLNFIEDQKAAIVALNEEMLVGAATSWSRNSPAAPAAATPEKIEIIAAAATPTTTTTTKNKNSNTDNRKKKNECEEKDNKQNDDNNSVSSNGSSSSSSSGSSSSSSDSSSSNSSSSSSSDSVISTNNKNKNKKEKDTSKVEEFKIFRPPPINFRRKNYSKKKIKKKYVRKRTNSSSS